MTWGLEVGNVWDAWDVWGRGARGAPGVGNKCKSSADKPLDKSGGGQHPAIHTSIMIIMTFPRTDLPGVACGICTVRYVGEVVAEAE